MKKYLNYKECSDILKDYDVEAPEKGIIIAKSDISDEIGIIHKGEEVLRLTPKGFIVYNDEFARETPAYKDGRYNGSFIQETTDAYGKKCTVVFQEEPSWEERVNICVKS